MTEPLHSPRAVAVVLDDAAQYIEDHGWTQGQSIDWETGSVCAIGAIQRVTGHQIRRVEGKFLGKDIAHSEPHRGLYQLRGAAEAALYDEVCRNMPKFEGGGIASWNDYPGRKSSKSVVRALRATAAKLRALNG